MVDASLPKSASDTLVRYLFLDLNAYFASVEQQERPELRGKPIAVVPLLADTTFVIAASYQAKRFGVKTVMRVDEAKRLCPEIQLIPARPTVYVHYHNLILQAVEDVLPVEKVHSVDEMSFRLIGEERRVDRALSFAKRLKETIRKEAGACMRCSIGIAPNRFLAKVATEMQKPDGLVVLRTEELPERLYGLELTDFPGINRKTKARLNTAGVFTVTQMCEASQRRLREAFGSIVGERWFHLLRGEDVRFEAAEGKSLSHSHVLAPALRTEEGCRQVILRLMSKAAARLRANGFAASRIEVYVSGKRSWSAAVRFGATNDSVTFTEHFSEMWQAREFSGPMKAGVVFTDLGPVESVTPSLFEPTGPRMMMSKAVDSVNRKYGKNTIYLAAMEAARDSAPERIAFNKTWLFQEGKGDNEWVDTFRGRPPD